MKISYNAIWDDTLALMRAHGSLIAALAGVFLFFPALVFAYLAPQPPLADPNRAMEALSAYFAANWPWLLLSRLVQLVGTIAILELIFARRGTSVGNAIAAGFLLLPFYFAAFFLGNLAIAFGFVLLIVPGLYLVGRLSTLGPVVVAEKRRNPIDALARTWAITKGHGWALTGLILLVGLGGAVAMVVTNALFGIVLLLIGGKTLGPLLAQIVSAATGAAFATLIVLLCAAIYRRLAGQGSAEVFA